MTQASENVHWGLIITREHILAEKSIEVKCLLEERHLLGRSIYLSPGAYQKRYDKHLDNTTVQHENFKNFMRIWSL